MAAEALYGKDCLKVALTQKQIASTSLNMKYHPLSEYLPMMPGHELDELAQDIKKHGLKESIMVFEKKILDGRNRFQACKRAGVKPKFHELDKNEDPLVYVVIKNLARRQLTPSQKAMAVAKITSITTGWRSRPGKPSKKRIGSREPISLDQAAETAGVSRSTTKRAKKVYAKSKAKAKEVEEGKITVAEAEREIEAEQKSDTGVVDALGYPVPEPALPYWRRSQEVKDVLRTVSKLKSWAEELHIRKDPLYSEINMNELRVDLGNIYTMIKCALPYAVCTGCQGQLPDTCTLCRGRGVISQFRYDHAIPEETRAMRDKQIQKFSPNIIKLQEGTLPRENAPEDSS